MNEPVGCLAALFIAWRLFWNAVGDVLRMARRVGVAVVDFAKDVNERRML